MAAPEPVPPQAASAPASPPGFARRHWGKLTILTIIGVPVVAITLWSMIALSYTYSSGYRTGFVQKLSSKGWICKTWEGELAMSPLPGVAPEIFVFTIRDDSLAAALVADMGKGRVSLKYDEHKGVPTSCLGDTPYFVTSYERITETPVTPEAPKP